MRDEYLNVNANVHRGVHWMSQQATEFHEAARERVRKFINARTAEEIVFTRGTTESINLIASSFVERFMRAGDEVIISTLEHHSNIVPWQLQAQRNGIVLRVIPIDDDGSLRLDEYERLFSPRTKLVSIAHVSNVLGIINPVTEIIRIAHNHSVPVALDGAQSVPHFKVDVPIWAAALGEIIGTGILGAFISYPIANFLLGKPLALLTLITSFSMSSISGACIGFVVLQILSRRNLLHKEA